MASKRVLITGGGSAVSAKPPAGFLQKTAGKSSPPAAKEKGQGDYRWVALDLNDSASIQRCAEQVLAEGTPDVVVHNAGYGLISPIETANLDAVKDQFQANFFGTLDLAQRLLPAMRERGEGVQAAVTSIGGRMAFPFLVITTLASMRWKRPLNRCTTSFGIRRSKLGSSSRALPRPSSPHTEWKSAIGMIPITSPDSRVLRNG